MAIPGGFLLERECFPRNLTGFWLPRLHQTIVPSKKDEQDMVVPRIVVPQIIHFNRIFPYNINHPFWGSPIYRNIHTSSTAQGGGGSFKNRKPIGEVGCCESGMAERSHWLTERWLELCLLEWLQWLQWSPHPQLLDVVWCTATVVVVVA